MVTFIQDEGSKREEDEGSAEEEEDEEEKLKKRPFAFLYNKKFPAIPVCIQERKPLCDRSSSDLKSKPPKVVNHTGIAGNFLL